jgi:hypothetical protein
MNKIPKIPSSLKTSALNEWLDVFPELSKYKPTMLFCRRGPVIIGLEFQWLMGNQRYRPHYEILPLEPNTRGSDLSSCLMYPLYFNQKTLNLNIEQNSLNSFLNGSKEAIRNYILPQCILPFNEKLSTQEIARRILAECKREKAMSIYGNLLGAYLTLIMLAALLKKADKLYSEFLLGEAVELISKMKTNVYARMSVEDLYNKPFDETVEMIINDYHNKDYEKVVEETAHRFKADKLKSL